MAFSNYLVKVGSYTIPMEYMAYGTYTIAANQRQDLDSYRDADGVLHRNVLPHTATKIEFNTIILSAIQFRELINGINSNLSSQLERKATVTYYDEESDSYKTGSFYMPGTMEYKRLNKEMYDNMRIAFIEY